MSILFKLIHNVFKKRDLKKIFVIKTINKTVLKKEKKTKKKKLLTILRKGIKYK